MKNYLQSKERDNLKITDKKKLKIKKHEIFDNNMFF